jgi:hypothetical protein
MTSRKQSLSDCASLQAGARLKSAKGREMLQKLQKNKRLEMLQKLQKQQNLMR